MIVGHLQATSDSKGGGRYVVTDTRTGQSIGVAWRSGSVYWHARLHGKPIGTVQARERGLRATLARLGEVAPTRKVLVVEFDVTGWADEQVTSLAIEAMVQGEASDEHPDTHSAHHFVKES